MENTKVIELARQLGHALQEDERYLEYIKAKQANDENMELQELIGNFNLKRIAINNAVNEENQDEEKVAKLNQELREIYTRIMDNQTMQKYNAAKTEMESLVNHINTIINMCANGENPDTVDPSACTGSCSTCGGCH